MNNIIKITGNVSTGKTSRLLLLAKENNGIIVCKNTVRMSEKAHVYGLTGIEFISYDTYIENMKHIHSNTRPVYIDDMSEFIKVYDSNVSGYTETFN